MSRAKPWQKIFDKTSDSWQSYKNKIQEAYVGEIQSSNPELTALTKANNRRKQLLDAWLVPEFEDDELGPFEYEPLPELDQPVVRIVQILPGRDYEPIEVFLDTCTLDADYESLSYAWGDPSATSPITCNGKRFYATKNLKAALRDLRRPHTPRAMWIDAISINQHDLEEREQQVSIMGKIYRSAVRTVIWLTDGFVGDEKTFTMLRRMQQTVGSKIADGSFDTDSLLWKDAHLDIEKEVEKPSDDEVAALWKVLRLPWFRRVWVIQECALAKDVLVTCGSQEMDWEDFFSGAVSTFFMGWHTGGQSTSTVFLTLFKINFARLGAAEGDETHELHLLTLLNNFRTSLATDPRDKIYAFFGLTNSPLKQLRLAPNYRTDTIDVYINLAKALIRDCDTLDILSVPRRAAGLALPLPSWCPDWMDTDVHENSLFARDEADNDDYPTKPFSASGFSTLPIPTFQPGNRLGLKGYRIDRVTSTSDWIPQTDQMQFDVLQTKADTVLSTGRGLRDLYKYVYVSLEGIAAQVDTFAVWDAFVFGPDDHDLETRYLFTNETREAAYMRTVCADFLPQGHDFALEAFRAWRKERWAQRWLRKGKVDRIPAGHSFLNAISTVIPNKEENQAFLGVLSEAKMRRLFWTEKGYLGMGPYDLEVNDEVWLIQGCRVPLVLRRTARTTERERIGDCYLHGSMYGERFNERQCGPVILI